MLEIISRIKEGDLENGVINRVRNKIQEGVAQSLFHDRIFWLESSYIQNLDYDVRVENLTNASEEQQFRFITASFNVTGLQIGKEDTTRLLGQHFELQKMHTQRNFENKDTREMDQIKSSIKEEVENEESELGVEDLNSDDMV